MLQLALLDTHSIDKPCMIGTFTLWVNSSSNYTVFHTYKCYDNIICMALAQSIYNSLISDTSGITSPSLI